jgi:hypothetical protein
MKIIDVPQTGKLGLTVTFPSRYGLIRRTRVVPANPNTASQQAIRGYFTASARAYDTLTEAQQNAWIQAAGQYHSRPTLGQSGPLTGLQLYTKLNSVLLQFGQEQLDAPPAKPAFGPNAPVALVITNPGGVPAIKLTCPSSPGEGTIVRAGKPQRSGTRSLPQMRVLGTCPAPVTGSSDITALYTAVYGAPVAGQRLFVQVNQMENGWQSLPTTFTALVPAAT